MYFYNRPVKTEPVFSGLRPVRGSSPAAGCIEAESRWRRRSNPTPAAPPEREDADQRRQKQNKRNQEDAAPRQAEKRGPEHFPGSLHHHVADRHPRRQRKRQALEPQRGAADADHLRIPAEQLDQERRRKEFGDGEHDQKNRRDFDAEAERPA